MTNEEIGKRITKALKAEALHRALEGKSSILSMSDDVLTAEGRVLKYKSSYDGGNVAYIRGSVLDRVIQKYPVGVTFEDLQRFCRWVWGRDE